MGTYHQSLVKSQSDGFLSHNISSIQTFVIVQVCEIVALYKQCFRTPLTPVILLDCILHHRNNDHLRNISYWLFKIFHVSITGLRYFLSCFQYLLELSTSCQYLIPWKILPQTSKKPLHFNSTYCFKLNITPLFQTLIESKLFYTPGFSYSFHWMNEWPLFFLIMF